MKTTPQHVLFALEYLKDKNASKAYERVYGPTKAAKESAYKLMRKPELKALIAEKLREQEERTEITADRILKALLGIAEFDLACIYDANNNLLPIHDWPEGARRIVAGIKVFEEFEGAGAQRKKIGETREVKLEHRTPALIALGKHLKLFVENIDLTSKGESIKALLLDD